MKEIMNRFLKNVLSNGEASTQKKIFRGNIDTQCLNWEVCLFMSLVGTEKYSLL